MTSETQRSFLRQDRGDGPVFGLAGINALMPMFLWLDRKGTVRAAGSTLAKLRPGRPLAGLGFGEVFEVRVPDGVRTPHDLVAGAGGRVQLRFRDPPHTVMRGLAVTVPRGGGVFVNLSLGISVVEAVQQYTLKLRDFAASDPSVDMLYLIEAHAAILAESRRLNHRLVEARAAAEVQAATDPLTGLHNRRALDVALGQLVRAREGRGFGLMHVDLDYFKQVNDTLGHAAGDHVLQEVARILREETGEGALVARFGGDEFVVVLHDCDDPDAISAIADRILARIERPIPWKGAHCRISASIGTTISTFYRRPEVDRLLSDADQALYASKNAGRARHTLFGPTLRPANGSPGLVER